MRTSTKRILAVGMPLATVAAAGVAFAAWTTSGTGTGSASSVDKQGVSYSTTTVTSQLYPTGKGDVKFSVDNPNSYKVQLNQFTVSSISFAGDATDQTSHCDLTFTGPGVGFGPIVANGSTTVTLVNALAMGNGAANDCANQTFDVHIGASTATSSSGTLAATWTAP